MTNLEYIYYISNVDEKKPFIAYFDRILAMCLRDDNSFEDIYESTTRYGYIDNKPVFHINGVNYDSQDYEELRKIICEQNMVELPDENMSKEVRDSLEEARKYKEKLSGVKVTTLEEYIVALSVATGWEIEYVYNLPVRKFLKTITRLDNLIHYKIYLAASMSGMVEFKDKSFIKHWLTSLEKEDKYGDVMLDYGKMKDKVSI